MPYMPCPACATRWVGGVSPRDCPVCDGEARLRINDRYALAEGVAQWPDRDRIDHGGHNLRAEDLTVFGARVVSTGVWLGLARAARSTAGMEQGARAVVLASCTARFRDCGVLGDEIPVGGDCGCFRELPGDGSLFAELCAAHEKPPRGRGRLGVAARVSASGHPSGLARVVDPLDLDSRPGKRFLEDRRVWNAADALDRAVTDLANTTLAEVPGFDLVEVAE